MSKDNRDNHRLEKYPISRKSQEQQEYDQYFQDNGVPYNLAGITKSEEYNNFEERITVERGLTRPRFTTFSLDEIKKIHNHLFQDVWSWAGNTRTYSTGRKGQRFEAPERIDSSLTKLLSELKAENYLRNLSKKEFIIKSAHYVNELNVCHPFVEGNGRVTRVFLADLCRLNGYTLDQTRINKNEWYKASYDGYMTDMKPLEAAISKALKDREQQRESLSEDLVQTPRKPTKRRSNKRNRDDNGREM